MELGARDVRLVDIRRDLNSETGQLNLYVTWRTHDNDMRVNAVMAALEAIFDCRLRCIRGRKISLAPEKRFGWEHSARFDCIM